MLDPAALEGLPTGAEAPDVVEFREEDTHPYDPSHGLMLDDVSLLNNLHDAPLLLALPRVLRPAVERLCQARPQPAPRG